MNEVISNVVLALGTQSRCDGSARSEIGRSEAVAGIYGPLEARISSNLIEGTLEVAYQAHSTATSAQEDADLSMVLKETLERCLKTLPRTTTSLSVRVLADEGCGFSAAVMAGVAALVDAGIGMVKIPVGIELAVMTDGSVLFEPRVEERALARVKILVIFCGDDEGPSACLCNGSISMAELNKCLRMARERASLLRGEMESSFKEHVAADKDLCIQ